MLRDRHIGNEMDAEQGLCGRNDHLETHGPRRIGTRYVLLRVLPCATKFEPQLIGQIPLPVVSGYLTPGSLLVTELKKTQAPMRSFS